MSGATSRLHRVTALLGLALTFVAALLGGVVLHLDTQATRSLARGLVGKLTDRLLRGRIEVERLDTLQPSRLSGGAVRIVGPDGVEVIRGDGIEASWSPWRLLRGLWAGPTVHIALDEVRVERAQVSLAHDERGELRLEQAFEPAPPDLPEPPPEVATARVTIERIVLGEGRVEGSLGGLELQASAHQAEGRLDASDLAVTVWLDRADVDARGLPHAGALKGQVRGRIEVEPAALGPVPWLVSAGFVGTFGRIPLWAAARIDRHGPAGLVDAGPVDVALLDRWLPAAMATEGRVQAVAEVTGRWEQLALAVELQRWGEERGTPQAVAFAGGLELAPQPTLSGAFELGRVDLSALWSNAPPSRLSASGRGVVRLGDEPAAEVVVAIEPGRVAGQPTPAARLEGDYRAGRASIDGSVTEPGLPVEVAATARFGKHATEVTAELSSDAVDLAALQRTETPLAGRGSLTLRGDLTVPHGEGEPTVRARAEATVEQLQIDEARLGRVRLSARGEGPLTTPTIRAELAGRGLRVGSLRFGRVRANAAGRLDRGIALDARLAGGSLAAARQVDAGAVLHLDDGVVSFRRARLKATPQQGSAVRVASRSVRIGPGGVTVDDVTVAGLGGPVDSSFQVRGPDRFRLRLEADRMALGRLEALLGREPSGLAGRASLDVDLQRRPGSLNGHAEVVLHRGDLGELSGLSGRAEADFAGRRIQGRIEATAPSIGSVAIDLDPLQLGADPRSPRALRLATGQVSVEASIDLARAVPLARTVGIDGRVVDELGRTRGMLELSAEATRDDAALPPDVALEVTSSRFAMLGPGWLRRAPASRGSEPRTGDIRGLDFELRAALYGEASDAELEVRVRDEHGGLLWIDVDAEPPYRSLWRDDLRRLRTEPPARWLRHMPIIAWAHTRRRSFAELPPLLGLGDFSGDVRVVTNFEGTLAEPSASLRVRTFELRHPSLPLRFPLDAELEGRWSGRRADVRATVSSRRRELLDGHLHVAADLAELLRGRTRQPWTATAQAKLCQAPLAALTPLADTQVRGRISGSLRLENLNRENVSFSSKLEVDRLRIGETDYEAGELTVRANAQRLRADAELAQRRGGATAWLEVPVDWSGAVPARDEARPVRARLRADRLQIAALQPVVEGTLAELEGRLDADLALRIDDEPELTGTAALDEGRFQIAGVGGTFHDAKAKVRMERGRVAVLERFEARAPSGRIVAQGNARGTEQGGLRADLDVQVAEGTLPVLVSGQHFGDAHGSMRAKALLSDDRLAVNVVVGELEVELPPRLPSGVQQLAPSERIRIGTQADGGFVPLELGPTEKPRSDDALSVRIDVELGDDVRIRRGRTMEMWLSGNPRVEITDRARVAGEIELTEGTLDLRGKEFEIERGTVTFTGRPPDDPMIVVTASWEAPDGTMVYADYVGPLESGKVKLRSNPPRPRDQILALIIFGRADEPIQGAVGGEGSSGTATQAVGLGGSYVAEGLNAALDDLSPVEAAARVDTSRGANPATELEVRIARDLSLQIAHVLGVPPPGESPDKNFATVEWRFVEDWALETTVGDHGSTSVDLLWRHRY